MFNFKSSEGTFKGVAGECFFRLGYTNSILPKFIPFEQGLKQLKYTPTQDQLAYLKEIWNSVDAIDAQFPILYEIKVKQAFWVNKGRKINISANIADIFTKSKTMGFSMKLVRIVLHDNWNYEIQTENLDLTNVNVEIPRKFNKLLYFKKNDSANVS